MDIWGDRLWGESRDILGDRFVIQIRGDRYLMMLDCWGSDRYFGIDRL